MAEIAGKTKLNLSTTFTVNEQELRALDALAGYGDDAFIEMFYKHLGKAYMQPHEQGMREFLKSIREIATPIIRRVDKARKEFVEG